DHVDLAGAPRPLVSVAIHHQFDFTQLDQFRQTHHRDEHYHEGVRHFQFGPKALLSHRAASVNDQGWRAKLSNTTMTWGSELKSQRHRESQRRLQIRVTNSLKNTLYGNLRTNARRALL